MEHQNNHWAISAGLVTSSVIAITANLFLLIIFCRKRGLRTVPNRFIINLLITNLLSSFLLIPLLIVDHQETVQLQPLSLSPNSSTSNNNGSVRIDNLVVIGQKITNFTVGLEIIETRENVLGTPFRSPFVSNETVVNTPLRDLLCYSAQSITSFVCTLSILSILLIGVNQYFGVIHSLRYHVYINKCRATIFIIATWLLALLFSALSCIARSDSTLWRFCKNKTQNSNPMRLFNTIFAVLYFVIVILAPFVAICVIYVCIYTAAHKNSARMRKSTSNNWDSYSPVVSGEKPAVFPRVRSAPNFAQYGEDMQSQISRTCSERNPQNNFITSLKCRLSNASVFKHREETRAAKISFLVIFLVLICYIPYGVSLVLNSDLIRIDTSTHFNYLSLILLVLSNIISPFLFAYRNKRVKREIGKIFGITRVPKLSNMERQNRRPSSIADHYTTAIQEPFLAVPEVIVTCKIDNERKSILKRVYNSSPWTNCKKCDFIAAPDNSVNTEARGSFSSASTQISSED